MTCHLMTVIKTDQGLIYGWTEHSLNHCNLIKCLFRHAKCKSVVNFYIVIALDQKLAIQNIALF